MTNTKRSMAWLVLFAMAISMALRYVWLYRVTDQKYVFNGYLMPTTHDAYHWLNVLETLTIGDWASFEIIGGLLPLISMGLSEGVGISAPWLAQNLPVLVSAFVVLPIILIGRSLDKPMTGFLAAVLTTTSVGYFNRTVPGYFDTDMLNLFFPLLTIWLCLQFLRNYNHIWIIAGFIVSALSLIWHPSSSALQLAIVSMAILYGLIRKPTSVLVYVVSGLIILISFWEILFPFLWDRVEVWGYRDNDTTPTPRRLFSLISETKPTSLSELSYRIAGNEVFLVAGLIGYAALLRKHKVMLIALPALLLGLSAVWLGRRFTIYASPIVALGIAHLIFLALSFVRQRQKSKLMPGIIFAGFAFATLYPGVRHTLIHPLTHVISASDAAMLTSVRKMDLHPRPIFVSWLDYGYALKYYTGNGETILDGGDRANGPLVATLLMNASSKEVSNIARKIVEMSAAACQSRAKDENAPVADGFSSSATNQCDETLNSAEPRPIYLYIPDDILPKLGTVIAMAFEGTTASVSKTGPVYRYHDRVQDKQINEHETNISWFYDKKGMVFDVKSGYYLANSKKPVVVNEAFLIEPFQDSQPSEFIHFDQSSRYSVIVNKSKKYLIVADYKLMNSIVLRGFVLNNLDYLEIIASSDSSYLFKINTNG